MTDAATSTTTSAAASDHGAEPNAPPDTLPGGAPHPLAVLAIAMILTPIIARATVGLSMLPGWDQSPLVLPSIFSGVGPGTSLLLDAITLAGTALALLAAARLPWSRGDTAALLCVAAGSVALLANTSGVLATVGDRTIGAAWAAAMWSAFALSRLTRDRRYAGLVLGAVAFALVLIAGRTLVQTLIDHPRVVADWPQSKAAILAAQGWTEGSPQALGYERRVLQNQATGWFPLGNPMASFGAAGVLLGAGLFAAARSLSRGATPGAPPAGTRAAAASALALIAASLTLLVTGRARGAFLALALAGGLMLFFAWLSRTPPRTAAPANARTRPALAATLAATLAIGAVAMMLAGLAVRHVLGERVAELSLLFRAWYAEAALRIFAHAPALGVGPDGFKDAYVFFKNPLNPEEVSSPHSIFLDWLACLGVLGAVLAVPVFLWLARAARSAAPTVAPAAAPPSAVDPDAEPPAVRPWVRAALLTPVAATFAAAALELPNPVPETAMLRLGSLVIGAAVAGGIAALFVLAANHPPARRWCLLGLAGAAAALVLHAQIEVTGSMLQSCGLWAALIGLAGAARGVRATRPEPTPDNQHRAPRSARALNIAAISAAAAVCGVFALSTPMMLSWQARLLEASALLRPLGEGQALLQRLAATAPTPDDRRAIRSLIDELAGPGVAAGDTPAALNAAMARVGPDRLTRAIELLPAAGPGRNPTAVAWPVDWRVHRERSTLALVLIGGPTPESIAQSLARWQDSATDLGPTQIAGVATPWAANSFSARAVATTRLLDLTGDGRWAQESLRALHLAAQTDRYNLTSAMQMLRLLERVQAWPAGPDAAVAFLPTEWPKIDGTPARVLDHWVQHQAARVLELNDLQRLDRAVRGLPANQEARVRRLANPAGAALPPATPPPGR